MIRKWIVMLCCVLWTGGCANFNLGSPTLLDGPDDKVTWSVQGVSTVGATTEKEYKEPVEQFIKDWCPKKVGKIKRIETPWRNGLNQAFFAAIVECDK
jgi:hypothetical protein